MTRGGGFRRFVLTVFSPLFFAAFGRKGGGGEVSSQLYFVLLVPELEIRQERGKKLLRGGKCAITAARSNNYKNLRERAEGGEEERRP